ncbi:DUF551 domain-containing protein [Eikenella sp. Marseille-P7795]|uniref:DUF551 domain-containing protein n=1 Tax=Eikenella sp. Marseille-P7795 TaxID=2866577 RepID=UPI001CE428A3|nr:DUF551 domain-containing protein [Eikenella sp. Marseille-P7795]
MKLTKIDIDQECKAFYEWFGEQPEIPGAEEFLKLQSMLQNATVQAYLVGWCARAAQSEWISVEERLPENDPRLMTKGSLGTNQKYFIYPNPLSKLNPLIPSVMYAYRCLEPETGEYVWGNSMLSPSVIVKNITHWQLVRLPEPPQP